MSKHKFPKRIYVRREHDPSDKNHSYLVAQETTDGLVGTDGSEDIALYDLMSVGKATAPTIIKLKPAR